MWARWGFGSTLTEEGTVEVRKMSVVMIRGLKEESAERERGKQVGVG